METSVSMLERLAGTPTDDDWRRLISAPASRLGGAGGGFRRRMSMTWCKTCYWSSSAR